MTVTPSAPTGSPSRSVTTAAAPRRPVQEAFVSIWRSAATYQSRQGTVAAWLLAIVRYRAIDIARRNETHTARRASDDALATLAGPGEAELAMTRADAQHLLVPLAQLPDAQREVITLAFYGQLTHAEIAAHLRLPPGTVKGRMRLGLEKLRESLASTVEPQAAAQIRQRPAA